MSTTPNNLPIQPTSFIGRTQAMAQLKQLLATTHLLTLTGVGGTGKTRLALQVATDLRGFQNLAGLYEDGIWFVELAPLADPALIPQTVASVLGVREESGRPISATLVDWLRPKHLVLLLDNCEHLIDACAQFADSVLHSAPDVKLLATSREALGIAGEQTYPVPSLQIPNPVQTGHISINELTQYEAVRLFIERAVSVLPSFTLTDANANAVAQICQRLDGIPLAIELAAARVKAMRVEQVAERLQDRFRLLTGGSRTALRRQQTLRAAIDWSHNLLSDEERVLLRRLSVFAGGWTLEAAEAVCAEPRPSPLPLSLTGRGVGGEGELDVLDTLTRLVDKSLVMVDEQSVAPRYRMLETIREYALEKLAESGESAAVRSRHLAYFLALVQAIAPRNTADTRANNLKHLERELDNLRTALSWAISTRDAPSALRLSASLGTFWFLRARHAEGTQWMQEALALNPKLESDMTVPSEDRAWFGYTLGLAGSRMALVDQGSLSVARAFSERSLHILRQTGPKHFLAEILARYAIVAGLQGDLTTGRTMIAESVATARESGDFTEINFLLQVQGQFYLRIGDYPTARSLLESQMAQARDTGNRSVIYWLGLVVRAQGDYPRARQLLEESWAMRSDSVAANPSILVTLGQLLLVDGRYIEARTRFIDALVWARQSESKVHLALCLLGFASLARLIGQKENAARWLSIADEAFQPGFGFVVNQAEVRADFERERETLRAQLGEEAFNAAWEAGKQLTLHQALAEAELLQVPEQATAPASVLAPKQDFSGLTAREREVATLVGQGLGNREIAEKLVVGERTIETHVSNIFNKLGFTARAQVRQWAKEKGLQ